MSKSITRDQINAINAKMSNGFRLDLRHWVMWKKVPPRRGWVD